MKKFKLITTALAASTLVLAGCGPKEHSHIDADGDFYCDECGEGLQGVRSITFSGVPEYLKIGQTLNIKGMVDVAVANGASKDVTFSLSNDKVATISNDGVLTGVANGTVKVTATSVFDSSKSAEVEIKVRFALGFEENGYEFMTTYPTDVLNQRYETSKMFVPSSDIVSQGIFVKHFEGTDKVWDRTSIVFNIGTETDKDIELGLKLMDELDDSDMYKFLDYQSGADAYLSSDNKFELDSVVEKDKNSAVYFAFDIYYAHDTFDFDAKQTENNDWTDEEKNLMMEHLEGQTIPFLKMGEDYYPEYMESKDVVEFVDFHWDHSIIDSYGDILTSNGFTYVEEYGAYAKPLASNPDLSLFVQPFFTSFGNTIEAFIEGTHLYEFPSARVASYLSDTMKSKTTVSSVPELGDATKGFFTVSKGFNKIYGNDGFIVEGSYTNKENCDAYVESLKAEGFTLTDSEVLELGIEGFDPIGYTYTLNKNAVQIEITLMSYFEFNPNLPEPFQFYPEMSTMTIAFTNSTIQGLFASVYDELVFTDQDWEVNVYFNALNLGEEPEITLTSSNEEVATVDEDFYVYPQGVGECTITAKASYEGEDYYDSFTVRVVPEKDNNMSLFNENSLNGITTADGIQISFSDGGKTAPEYAEGVITLHKGNTFTLSAPNGTFLNKLVLDSFLGLEASNGVVYDGVWYGLSEDCSEVTFKCLADSYTFSSTDIYFGGHVETFGDYVIDLMLTYFNYFGFSYTSEDQGGTIHYIVTTNLKEGEGFNDYILGSLLMLSFGPGFLQMDPNWFDWISDELTDETDGEYSFDISNYDWGINPCGSVTVNEEGYLVLDIIVFDWNHMDW